MGSNVGQAIISKENIQEQLALLQNKQSSFPWPLTLLAKKQKTLVVFYWNSRKEGKRNRQLEQILTTFSTCSVKHLTQGKTVDTTPYETVITVNQHTTTAYEVNKPEYKQVIEGCFHEQGISIKHVNRQTEQRNNSLLHIQLSFCFQEEVPTFLASLCSLIRVINKQKEFNSHTFHSFEIYQGIVSLNFPLDRIELSRETMKELNIQQHDGLFAVNLKNGTASRGLVIENNRIENGAIRLSKRIKNTLHLLESEPNQIFVVPANHMEAAAVAPQNINAIHKRRILVSADMFERFQAFPAVELVNSLTGAAYTVNKENIVGDNSLSSNKMKLSYLQRQLLDFEAPPSQIPAHFLQTINEQPVLTEEEKKELTTCYGGDNIFIPNDYLHGNKIKRLLLKTGLYTIKLYPFIPEKSKVPPFSFIKKPFTWLSEKLIGQTSIQLSTIRPYSTDESSNVIRLSDSSMKLLGIEETDNVIIKYKEKQVKARVLSMESVDLMRETNIITSTSQINLTAGIPVHIRDQLGITHIGKTCEIERDLGYLLKKNYNIQFLPLIAVLFTLFSIDIKLEWRILLACILFPLGIYVTFSRLREKISNT